MKTYNVKIELKNGSSYVGVWEEEALQCLVEKIGTKKGKKARVTHTIDNEFVVVVVPNEIVAIINLDKE